MGQNLLGMFPVQAIYCRISCSFRAVIFLEVNLILPLYIIIMDSFMLFYLMNLICNLKRLKWRCYNIYISPTLCSSECYSVNSVISFILLGTTSSKKSFFCVQARFHLLKKCFLSACIITSFVLWPQSLGEMKNMLGQEKRKSLQIPPKS